MEAIIVSLFFYFLPSLIVSSNRDKKSKAPTVIINLFLGWTFVGWVIALAMAVAKD